MKYFSLLMIAGVLTFSACNNSTKADRAEGTPVADTTTGSGDDVVLSAKEVLDEAAPKMKNPVDSFTITAPAGWKTTDTIIQKIGMRYISAPEKINGFRSNIVVVSEDMAGLSLDKYFIKATEWLKKGLKDQYKDVSKADLLIDSVPAKVLKFETTQSKIDVVAAVYVVAKNNTAYTLTFMTSKELATKDLPVLQRTISSFKFK